MLVDQPEGALTVDQVSEELKDCEMCIVLYGQTLGTQTKQEMDFAYEELKQKRNPQKLYVYFKEGDDCAAITEDLKAFKESFVEVYGHFSTIYQNEDALKAHFVLQFIDYMTGNLHENNIVAIQDAKVMAGADCLADLTKVPFMGNNEEYRLLVKSIQKNKKILAVLDVSDPEYSEYAQELQELEKKKHTMEENLWETALKITKLSSSRQSERLRRAIELFNAGDNKGAQAVLNEEEIDRDVKNNLHLVKLGEEGKKGLKTNIEEYQLKIQTIKNEYAEGWGNKVIALHKKILEIAAPLYGEQSLEMADYLDDAASDLVLLGQFKQAIEWQEKTLEIRQAILDENHPDVATSYNNVGCTYGELGDHLKELEYMEKALSIWVSLLGENHPLVATSYNNVGVSYGKLGHQQKALDYIKKALKIRLYIFGEYHPNIALSYNNIGSTYGALGDYQKALAYEKKSVKNSVNPTWRKSSRYSAVIQQHRSHIWIVR